MHSSTKIDVLLAISSNPIIEDCKVIRFSEYPDIFKTPAERTQVRAFPICLSYPQLNYIADANTQTLPPISVQDFSHIRATPSPNYSVLTEDDTSRLASALVLARCNRSSNEELSDVLPV